MSLLVLPTAEDTRFASLRRKVRLLALRRLLTPEPALPQAHQAALARLAPVLTGLARTRKAELLEALGRPDVLVHLLLWQRGHGSPTAHVSAAVPALLAALPVPEAVVWDVPVEVLADPKRGFCWRGKAEVLVAHPTGLELSVDGERLAWPLVDAERAYVPLHPDLPHLHLALDDTNPLHDVEEHPDKDGNALDLGGHPVEEWQRSYQEALELIRVGLPDWWRELPLSLERLVPVGYFPEQHLSASYQDAPGLAYLSLHPNVLTLAEALVHETQHGKLNTLLWLDPVLHNARTTWTASPVRPDLRPLVGVLLAAHAFVPVAAMHQALAGLDHPISRTPEFARRREEVINTNARGLDILRENADASSAGRRLLDGLETLHARTAAA